MLSIFETNEINLVGAKDSAIGLFVDGVATSAGGNPSYSIVYDLTTSIDEAIFQDFLLELQAELRAFVTEAKGDISASRSAVIHLLGHEKPSDEKRIVISIGYVRDPSMQAVGKVASAYIKNPVIFRAVRRLSEIRYWTLRVLGLGALAESEGSTEMDAIAALALDFERRVLAKFNNLTTIRRVEDYQHYSFLLLLAMGFRESAKALASLPKEAFEREFQRFKLDPLVMFGVLGQRFRISRFALVEILRKRNKEGAEQARATQVMSYVASGIHRTDLDPKLKVSCQIAGIYTMQGSVSEWIYHIQARSVQPEKIPELYGAGAWKYFKLCEREDLALQMKRRPREIWTLDDAQWLTNIFQTAVGGFNPYARTVITLPTMTQGQKLVDDEPKAEAEGLL